MLCHVSSMADITAVRFLNSFCHFFFRQTHKLLMRLRSGQGINDLVTVRRQPIPYLKLFMTWIIVLIFGCWLLIVGKAKFHCTCVSKFWRYYAVYIVFSMNIKFPTPRLEIQFQINSDSFPNFNVGTTFCFSSVVNALHHTLLGPSF